MWCKQRNGDGGGGGEEVSRSPKGFSPFFSPSRTAPGFACACAGPAAQAEEHERLERSRLLRRNSLGTAAPASALRRGEPRRSPAGRRSRQAESETGAHRPGAAGFPVLRGSRSGEGGRESRALPPPQPLRPAHTHARTHARTQARTELPTPAAEPQPCPHPGSPRGSPGSARGAPGNFEPCLPPSHPCGCRGETCPLGGGGHRFLPVAVMMERRRRRKAEAEARCRPGGRRAAARSAAARGAPPPGSPPAPQLAPRPGAGLHSPTDLFLAAAALSRCLRFLNQLPTCVGVSPVA